MLQCSTAFEVFTACNQIAKCYTQSVVSPLEWAGNRVLGGVEHEITLLILDLKQITHKKCLSLFTACSSTYCVFIVVILGSGLPTIESESQETVLFRVSM